MVLWSLYMCVCVCAHACSLLLPFPCWHINSHLSPLKEEEEGKRRRTWRVPFLSYLLSGNVYSALELDQVLTSCRNHLIMNLQHFSPVFLGLVLLQSLMSSSVKVSSPGMLSHCCTGHSVFFADVIFSSPPLLPQLSGIRCQLDPAGRMPHLRLALTLSSCCTFQKIPFYFPIFC